MDKQEAVKKILKNNAMVVANGQYMFVGIDELARQICQLFETEMQASRHIEDMDVLLKDEIRYLDDKQEDIDEIVMSNADVHLEILSNRCAMLILDNSEYHWHFNICHNSPKAVLHVHLYESELKAGK